MSTISRAILGSSILRKQVVALTGLAMIGFVVAHLMGNLLIFVGPDAFNAYAKKLQSLGGLLWVFRIGLIAAIVIHMGLTFTLIMENRRARGVANDTLKPKGDRSWATRTMAISGLLIVAFLVLHLYDFTFATKDGPQSSIAGVRDGESLHLFGLVWYSFNQSWRVAAYVLAMAVVGMHLSHAVESVFQTFGLHHPRYTPIVKRISLGLGIVVALAFSGIPLYVLFANLPNGI